MFQMDLHSNEILELNGNLFWSSKGDRKSRREEIISKSSIASTANSIEYNPNGKPYLCAGPVFSMAHSLKYSVLVVSNVYSSIGIDIEVNRPFKYWERIAKRYFLESEKKYCADGNGLERFWQIWVKKEAVVKCLGGSIIEDALKIDTLEFSNLISNSKSKILYNTLRKGGSSIHVSVAYCQ